MHGGEFGDDVEHLSEHRLLTSARPYFSQPIRVHQQLAAAGIVD
jgi:hypothetical protein